MTPDTTRAKQCHSHIQVYDINIASEQYTNGKGSLVKSSFFNCNLEERKLAFVELHIFSTSILSSRSTTHNDDQTFLILL